MEEADLPAALASALESATTEAGVTFRRVAFTLPDRETATSAFWREHLDHLQIRRDIAAFGVRADERRIALLTADHRAAAVLENVVVLDRDGIMVRDCTPMRQEPVPGSSTRPGRVLYPDYPLRADYLGLWRPTTAGASSICSRRESRSAPLLHPSTKDPADGRRAAQVP